MFTMVFGVLMCDFVLFFPLTKEGVQRVLGKLPLFCMSSETALMTPSFKELIETFFFLR